MLSITAIQEPHASGPLTVEGGLMVWTLVVFALLLLILRKFAWPAILGAFIVSFLLAFNNLEISFYNLGATPTLPTLAWGSLRHGVSEELYALAALINAAVFILLAVLYLLLRTGMLKIDYRD